MKDAARIARFLLTGVLNAAFGYAVYAALVMAGLDYLAALLVATLAGVVFNFFSFGRLAFRVAARVENFARFGVAYAGAFTFNALLLWGLKEKLGVPPIAAQLVCIPPTVLLTYVILNRWVYPQARPRGN